MSIGIALCVRFVVGLGVVIRCIDRRRTRAALGDVRRLGVFVLTVLATFVAGERCSCRLGLVNGVALVDGRAGVRSIGGETAIIDVDAVGNRAARSAYHVDALGAVQRAAREANAAAVRGGDRGVVGCNCSRAARRGVGLASSDVIHLAVTDGLRSFVVGLRFCLAVCCAGSKD